MLIIVGFVGIKNEQKEDYTNIEWVVFEYLVFYLIGYRHEIGDNTNR